MLTLDRWLDIKFKAAPASAYEEEILFDHRETRATYAEYVVMTWEDPRNLLISRFSLDEIGESMWREEHVYMDPLLPRNLRDRAWKALSNLFQSLFEPLVSDKLGHLGESALATEKIDGACYMWWDVSPYFPGSPYAEPADDAAFLSVCRQCLYSSRPAIQESAIHGLGHALGTSSPLRPAAKLLDGYIRSRITARRELVSYAKLARKGMIQ